MIEYVSDRVALGLFFTVLFDRALDSGLASLGDLKDFITESFEKLGLAVVQTSSLNK